LRLMPRKNEPAPEIVTLATLEVTLRLRLSLAITLSAKAPRGGLVQISEQRPLVTRVVSPILVASAKNWTLVTTPEEYVLAVRKIFDGA